MPRLSDLSNRTCPVKVTIDDDEFLLAVRPNVLTPERESELAASDDVLAGVSLFVAFVAAWNVEDDDGNEVPITIESISAFPSRLIVRLMLAAREVLAEGN